VQIPFNLLDRRWVSTDVQRARARREDVIVTARSVFLQGLLAAGKDARWPTNAGVNVAALISALARAAADLGRKSVADLSLAYVRGHSFVTSVVLGAETVDQVRDQAVLMRCPPLSASDIEAVHRSIPSGTPILVDPSQWTMES
jgi:aryl-alcohol dehydrogenase-like predicted oxidoreductase